MKSRRYYGLIVSSIIYKSIALMAVLFALGGIGYLTLEAMELSGSTGAFDWWLPRAVLLTVTCGLFAFTSYVLSQLIDVQVSTNDKLNTILERLDTFTETADKLKETDRLVSVAIERQNRLLTINARGDAPKPKTEPKRPDSYDVPARLIKRGDVETEAD